MCVSCERVWVCTCVIDDGSSPRPHLRAKLDEVVGLMNGDGEGNESNGPFGATPGPVTADTLLKVVEELARSH